MNFPKKAFSTFKTLGAIPEYKNIFNFVDNILNRISDPAKRAKKVHQYVEAYTQEVLNGETAKKFVTCSKGCSACCHTQVSTTFDEAILLAQRVVDEGIEIDLQKLYIQGDVENDARKWFELSYDMRGCVFLDEEGLCKVYEDRPSVCRTNNVLSEPKNCETKDGLENPVRLLNTDKADIAMIAGYKNSPVNGALPHMLWKALGVVTNKSDRQFKRFKKKLKTSRLERVKKELSKFFEL